VSEELTQRARTLLDAIEREVEERRRAMPVAPSPQAQRPLRADALLLAAVELSVAGLTREEVERRLREELAAEDPERMLDAVFGEGSPRQARLRRG
jgi:hypothetical protein